MSQSNCQFRLPNLFAACPLTDGTNPYYKDAAAESRAWINGFDIFTDRKRAFFIQGQNELLCSHVYCFADFEQFRTTCDFVRLKKFQRYFLMFIQNALDQPPLCRRRDKRRTEWQ